MPLLSLYLPLLLPAARTPSPLSTPPQKKKLHIAPDLLFHHSARRVVAPCFTCYICFTYAYLLGFP